MNDGEVQVPKFITGTISDLQVPDICMDGATHLIQHSEGTTRLKGQNDEATALLKKFWARR